MTPEEKLLQFFHARMEFEKKEYGELGDDEETREPEPEEEPGERHRAFLSESLERYGLDIVLEGIKKFEEMDHFSEPNDLSLLAILLAERGQREDARRVAHAISGKSFSDQMTVITDIALVTHAKEDILYAHQEAKRRGVTQYALVLATLAPVEEDPEVSVRMARTILGAMLERGNDLEEVARALVVLSMFTQTESDLLLTVRVINHPQLDPADASHILFEGVFRKMRDTALAHRMALQVKNPEWRTNYQRIINNKRPDLN